MPAQREKPHGTKQRDHAERDLVRTRELAHRFSFGIRPREVESRADVWDRPRRIAAAQGPRRAIRVLMALKAQRL
jgi:hypothetical protein